MSKRKPFSILKWLVFPTLSLALAAIVAWFNLRTFGWEDGAIYLGVVAVITAFSIAINKYVKLIDDDDPSNDHLAITAFVFEIILTLALAINAAYSLSVQREMSIARQTEDHQSKDLETVSKLKDRRAQREAARMLREQSKGAKTSQSIFAENERVLFWIMAGEMLAYIVAAFTLYAVSQLIRRKPKAVHVSAEPRETFDFPDEIDIRDRAAPRRENLKTHVSFKQEKTPKTHVSFNSEGLKRLRESLKDISFRLAGMSFKADVKDDAVWIRMMRANQGTQETVASAKARLDILTDAITMPRAAFQERLEKFLRENGFKV